MDAFSLAHPFRRRASPREHQLIEAPAARCSGPQFAGVSAGHLPAPGRAGRPDCSVSDASVDVSRALPQARRACERDGVRSTCAPISLPAAAVATCQHEPGARPLSALRGPDRRCAAWACLGRGPLLGKCGQRPTSPAEEAFGRPSRSTRLGAGAQFLYSLQTDWGSPDAMERLLKRACASHDPIFQGWCRLPLLRPAEASVPLTIMRDRSTLTSGPVCLHLPSSGSLQKVLEHWAHRWGDQVPSLAAVGREQEAIEHRENGEDRPQLLAPWPAVAGLSGGRRGRAGSTRSSAGVVPIIPRIQSAFSAVCLLARLNETERALSGVRTSTRIRLPHAPRPPGWIVALHP